LGQALAFADDENGPAILITTDNLGVPDQITQAVADHLGPKIGLKRERLAITATHTHTAPMLRGVAPTLFGVEIPAEHQERIDRYTQEFTQKLVESRSRQRPTFVLRGSSGAPAMSALPGTAGSRADRSTTTCPFS
jgi:hypothetical protein